MRSAIHSRVLVLNASYEPLHVCAARRALTLIVKDAAHIQEHAGPRSSCWNHVPDGDPAEGVS